MDIRPISAEEARPVRQAVLRPDRPPEEVAYGPDDDPRTLHLGAFDEGEQLVAVGTVMPDPPPGEAREDAWRIRGMATLDGHRGEGIGTKILDGLLRHANRNGAGLVWCNARIAAVPLYERAGFAREGEEFQIHGAGRHYLMRREAQA